MDGEGRKRPDLEMSRPANVDFSDPVVTFIEEGLDLTKLGKCVTCDHCETYGLFSLHLALAQSTVVVDGKSPWLDLVHHPEAIPTLFPDNHLVALAYLVTF